MMRRQSVLVLLGSSSLLGVSSGAECSASSSKIDCGYVGITESECEAKGCCWHEEDDADDGVPWCFYGETCFLLERNSSAPFSETLVAQFKANMVANIDIAGAGAVAAAPDASTPGGSYYFHWARDGALAMRAVQLVLPFNESRLEDYASWVAARHAESDPNGIDVRVEPKFEIPSGDVYTGAWCRPQNDGPGLRAIALMMSGLDVWDTIRDDLDYVVSGYEDATCDLWEEVESDDFFWNRVTMRTALRRASAYDASYAAVADAINATLVDHFSTYFFESDNRRIDGAVVVALNMNDDTDDFTKPSGIQVAQTVGAYLKVFCAEYPINVQDTTNGVPGAMIGRYPGDTYAGGNPWILTTAALAQLLYRAALDINAAVPTDQQLQAWENALRVTSSKKALAADLAYAGDSVLRRINAHVATDAGRLDEQIDKNTGDQTSAQSLTWSYAEVLLALAKRDEFYATTRAKIMEEETASATI